MIWCWAYAPNSFYLKKSSGRLFHISRDSIEVMKGVGFKENLCVSQDHSRLSYINGDIDLVIIHPYLNTRDTVLLQEKLKQLDFSFSNPRHMTDDGHSIWITGQNGVLRYNMENRELRSYTTKDGLSHTFTFSVVTDHNNMVWVGSMGGVDRYNPSTDRFEQAHRMISNTYMDAFGKAICTPTGELFFHFETNWSKSIRIAWRTCIMRSVNCDGRKSGSIMFRSIGWPVINWRI